MLQLISNTKSYIDFQSVQKSITLHGENANAITDEQTVNIYYECNGRLTLVLLTYLLRFTESDSSLNTKDLWTAILSMEQNALETSAAALDQFTVGRVSVFFI